MSELLDRTVDARSVEPRARGTGPPTPMPDIERYLRPRWPRNAKIVVAVLAVLALAGAAGTIVQLVEGSETGDDARIAELTEQRDDLLGENAGLATEVASLETEAALLEAELDGLAAELATARVQDAISSERIADLTTEVDGLQAIIDSVTDERDALVSMFPMIVDTSLAGVDVTGTYTVRWLPAYNSGLSDIALPGVGQVTIGRSSEGWLEVNIPGVVTADLARTDGALFTMVDTTTAVPAVNGVARTARVAITIYAGETVTTVDGSTTVRDLGMSIAISTPAVANAPAGVALYGAELTAQR